MASRANPDGMPVNELLALLQKAPSDKQALAAIMESFNALTVPGGARHIWAWNAFGATVTVHPQRSLAAWLGHAPSVAALESQACPVPKASVLVLDPDLKPDPYGLGLSAEQKSAALFVRCVALWGPQALQRAALACAELQWLVQTRCPAALQPLRDAAMAGARAHAARPGESTRLAARVAAEACWARWERHRNPDSAAAKNTWEALGAPWFAATLAGRDMPLETYDGPPPRVASSSWGARHTTDLGRAVEAAEHWAGHTQVLEAMTTALLTWALSDAPAQDFR